MFSIFKFLHIEVSDLSGWRRRCPEFCTEVSQAETARPEQPSRSSHRPESGSWEPTSCSRPTAAHAPQAPDAGLKNTAGAAVRRAVTQPRSSSLGGNWSSGKRGAPPMTVGSNPAPTQSAVVSWAGR